MVVDVRTNDATDFERLYAEVGPRLWRAILAYTGGRRDLTDDVVAEAFARTIEAGASVRRADAYAYRVAFRLAARELRRPSPVSDVADEPAQEDHALAEVFDALMHLSPGQRAAVFLPVPREPSRAGDRAPHGHDVRNGPDPPVAGSAEAGCDVGR
jgi:DNA-directed RNA polymerase specialized sigma24 family protein